MPNLRDFRRLPLLLRVVRILGLLFLLAALLLLSWELITHYRAPLPWDFDRVVFIALDLEALGGACNCVTQAYNARSRESGWWRVRLSSWQSQLRAIVLLAALPVCGVVSASIMSPTQLALTVVFLVSILAWLVLLVAYIWMSDGRQAVS